MIAIAHFTMGVAGGAFLLTYFPKLVKKYIGNLIKNDTFFLFASGIFAMLPDIKEIYGPVWVWAIHDSPISNIFWGHHYMDKFADTPETALVPIVLAGIMLYLYYQKVKKIKSR